MDQVYIDALVAQAIGAYKAGGDAGLERWKQALPAHNRKEFERDCSKPLQKAIEKLQGEWAEQTEAVEVEDNEVGLTGKEAKRFIAAVLDDDTQSSDPPFDKTQDVRKKHTRDRRRTKPL